MSVVPVKPRVAVRKSRGEVFKGTWYVIAFGKCYRRETWHQAIKLAIVLGPKHTIWAQKSAGRTRKEKQNGKCDQSALQDRQWPAGV